MNINKRKTRKIEQGIKILKIFEKKNQNDRSLIKQNTLKRERDSEP